MSASALSAAPHIQVLRGEAATGRNLIANPGFEETQNARARDWVDWQGGYSLAPGAGRNGSDAITCALPADGEQLGATHNVTLDQQRPTPLLIKAWSRAQDVTGTADRNYSLYCDLTYTDGTPLWGQITPFGAGTHDWQQREVMIVPAKPVQSISVHCLFRNHRGQVWFDAVELYELRAAAGTAILDGVPVLPEVKPVPALGDEKTGGGVSLLYGSDGARVFGVVIGRQAPSPGPTASGFLARDVAANSDFCGFDDGKCDELGLELAVEWTETPDALRASGTLRDSTGQDRAVTLLFALPVAARGCEWGVGIQESQTIEDSGEYTTSVRMGTGATGTMAQYPFSCVYGEEWGLALGVDPNSPCQYRLAYNADTQQYYAAFDFGLVRDTRNFPSAARFKLVMYAVDPKWGFRSAAQRYYDIFPESFASLSKRQGIWMPFGKISEVEGWEDFGFRYKEGTNETAWDDENDMLTFRYTEPSTWWMSMPEDMPRTYEAAMAEAERIATEGTGSRKLKAQALLTSGLFDDQGRYVMQFRDTPWCDGAVFSMSCLPQIEGDVIDARIGWNEQVKASLYGPDRTADQDGEYLDSLEGYVTSDVDFRREHFSVVNRPLTFTRSECRPVIHKGLAVDEFVQWMADDVHAMGKLMMANGVPSRFTFLCRNLDVMGTETDWVRGGNWQPMSHTRLSTVRTMCAQKPYLFLMNTDYDALEPYVERYFQRSLFYGMYPSMFSPVASSSHDAYWRTPRWYNRDRPLHKKYQPLIRRVAEAGWQPITLARTDTPDVLVERFGPNQDGEVFITVFSDGPETATATVWLYPQLLPSDRNEATELVSGDALQLKAYEASEAATVRSFTPPDGSARFDVTLGPEQCAAVLLGS